MLDGRLDIENGIVRVVGTASGLSRLAWLTNAEDDARADAAGRAEELADVLPTDRVEATQGDVDPLQAIEDEVRGFHPARIVVVTKHDEDARSLVKWSPSMGRAAWRVPATSGLFRQTLFRRARRPASRRRGEAW